MIESLTYENTTWTKHDWSIGEPITEEKMDNIENGIAILASQAGGDASSVEVEYQVGTSGTNPPTSTWTARIPTVPKGRYLWTRFTFGNGTIGYSVSYMGVDGDGSSSSSAGIVDVLANYCVSSDGTNPPSSGWSSSIPTLQKGRYLWTRLSFLDNSATTISTAYSVAYSGTDGSGGGSGTDGRAIESMRFWYNVSASQQPPSTSASGWSTTPTMPSAALPYLYGYTAISYSDETSYNGPAHLVGIWTSSDGSSSSGPAIDSITEYYMIAASQPSTEDTGWSRTAAAPTAEKPYLYGYNMYTYTDGGETEGEVHLIAMYSGGGSTLSGYYIACEPDTLVKTNGTITPSSVVVYARNASGSAYSGYFSVIYYDENGGSTTEDLGSSAASTKSFSIGSNSIVSVTVQLFSGSGRTANQLLCSKTIPVVGGSGGSDSSPLFVDITTTASDNITLPNSTQLKEGCLNIFMLQRGTLGNTNLRINGIYVRRTRGDYLAQQLPEKYILECYYNGSYLYALNLPAILV